jgi:CcmD family protein
MNAIAFLKAAYAIAWIIYVGYLAKILLRMRRVEEELKEVEIGSVSSRSDNATAGVQRQQA